MNSLKKKIINMIKTLAVISVIIILFFYFGSSGQINIEYT